MMILWKTDNSFYSRTVSIELIKLSNNACSENDIAFIPIETVC